MTRVVLGLAHLTAVEFFAMPALQTRVRIAAAFERPDACLLASRAA
jgi:hypothetical protein